MDPFGLATGVVSLVALALQLVTGARRTIDKTKAAHDEAADQLRKLQDDLEDLQSQVKDIHRTLKVLATNTKDRGLKKLLRNKDCNTALENLCTAFDKTSGLLKRLTDQTKAQGPRLHSLSPPQDPWSLEFIRAILKHKLSASKASNLVKTIRDVRYEIKRCPRKLDNSFQHLWKLYIIMSNGLTSDDNMRSTISQHPDRVKLVRWVEGHHGAWGSSGKKNGATTVARYENKDATRTAVVPVKVLRKVNPSRDKQN